MSLRDHFAQQLSLRTRKICICFLAPCPATLQPPIKKTNDIAHKLALTIEEPIRRTCFFGLFSSFPLYPSFFLNWVSS